MQEGEARRLTAFGASLALVGASLSAAAPREARDDPRPLFSESVWKANQDVYEAILEHPFLAGLQDGSLPREAFVFYLIQDTHYLREFARALQVTAAKAPKQEWAELLHLHAKESIEAERLLHVGTLAELGISDADVAGFDPAPEAFGYTSFLVATAHEGTFAESLAALLPCYWIYYEVGKSLADAGSTDAKYQAWIDQYASEEYGATVRQVIAIVDEQAASVTDPERERMRAHFRRSSRYEWMFWDSSYHRRGWPPR